ncbi:DUF6318 family protein [Modestobacter sp. URMC 112]
MAVLAGCSDGPEPASDSLPSAAPTSAGASETLPPLGPPDFPMPPEAREQTPAGAESFLRYYLNLYNRAQADLNTAYMSELSKDCETCDQLINNMNEDAQNSRSYEGGTVEPVSITPASLADGRAELAFSLAQSALVVRTAEGATIGELSAPPATLQCGAVLTWSTQSTSWVFSQWDVT